MLQDDAFSSEPHDRPSRHGRTMATDDLLMNFGDHIEELRKRLILSIAGTSLMFIGTLYFGSHIMLWLLKPLVVAQREAGVQPMTVAGITSGFTTYVLVAAVAAIVFSSPWVLYQLWQFVSAGLYASERKLILTIAPLSGIMSVIGIAFFYYILLPVGLFFFLSFTASYPTLPKNEVNTMSQVSSWLNRMATRFSGVGMSKTPPPTPTDQTLEQTHDGSTSSTADATTAPLPITIPILKTDPNTPIEGQIWLKEPEHEIRVMLNHQVRVLGLEMNTLLMPLVHVGEYMRFVSFLALGVVLTFQTPVLMLMIGHAGLISSAKIRPYRRYAFFICFILGAIFTPPDPITMTLLAVPMYLLFEFGLLLMWFGERTTHNEEIDDETPISG